VGTEEGFDQGLVSHARRLHKLGAQSEHAVSTQTSTHTHKASRQKKCARRLNKATNVGEQQGVTQGWLTQARTKDKTHACDRSEGVGGGSLSLAISRSSSLPQTGDRTRACQLVKQGAPQTRTGTPTDPLEQAAQGTQMPGCAASLSRDREGSALPRKQEGGQGRRDLASSAMYSGSSLADLGSALILRFPRCQVLVIHTHARPWQLCASLQPVGQDVPTQPLAYPGRAHAR
jgi:hypothetical protein